MSRKRQPFSFNGCDTASLRLGSAGLTGFPNRPGKLIRRGLTCRPGPWQAAHSAAPLGAIMISKFEELALLIVSRANGSATTNFVQSELAKAAKEPLRFG